MQIKDVPSTTKLLVSFIMFEHFYSYTAFIDNVLVPGINETTKPAVCCRQRHDRSAMETNVDASPTEQWLHEVLDPCEDKSPSAARQRCDCCEIL